MAFNWYPPPRHNRPPPWFNQRPFPCHCQRPHPCCCQGPPPRYHQGPPPPYSQRPPPRHSHGAPPSRQHCNQQSPRTSPHTRHHGAHDGRNLHWVKASNGHIPLDALQSGIEADGKPLFLARAPYQGGMHPGKVGRHIQGGGFSVGYGHREQNLPDYEVLCGDPSRLRWVKQEGALNIQGFVPVPVGREATGEPLYAAKTLHEGSMQPGKCAPHINKGMSFAYGHKECETNRYMVLAYKE